MDIYPLPPRVYDRGWGLITLYIYGVLVLMESLFIMSTTIQQSSMDQLIEQILFEYAEPQRILLQDDLDLVESILRRYAWYFFIEVNQDAKTI